MKKQTVVLIILVSWLPWFAAAWDKDKPASSTSLRNSNPEILANWSALEDAIGQDHEFSTGGTNSGNHEVLTMEEEASAGASSTNELHVQAIDGGSGQPEFAVTSEDGNELQMTKDGDLFSSAGLTVTNASTFNGSITLGAGDDLIGSSTSDIDFNSKFTVAGATGNTVIAGTLGVTGETTLTGGLAATTMSGALAMGTNPITGLGAADAAGEAVRYEQVFNSLSGGNESNGEATIGDMEIKWGQVTLSSSPETHTFSGLTGIDSAFSNACFQVVGCPGGPDAGGAGAGTRVYDVTTTGFKTSSESFANDTPLRFFAIGR